jgi:predicted dehydrogenase
LVRNGRLGRLDAIEVEIQARPGSSAPWKPQPIPPELDYDMWLGPAPWAPYHPDRCHYNFRFVSDYSGGDVTNWGAHHLDIVQWALDADDSGPLEVEGRGQRNASGLHDVFYDVHVDFTYPDGVSVQLRSDLKSRSGGFVRFQGADGWILVSRDTLDAEPKSLLTSRIGPDEIHLDRGPEGAEGDHMAAWLHAVRARSSQSLNAPAEIGHRSATVCHLANIAMTLGRKLRWDALREQFIEDDEANRMTRRPLREPWRI